MFKMNAYVFECFFFVTFIIFLSFSFQCSLSNYSLGTQMLAPHCLLIFRYVLLICPFRPHPRFLMIISHRRRPSENRERITRQDNPQITGIPKGDAFTCPLTLSRPYDPFILCVAARRDRRKVLRKIGRGELFFIFFYYTFFCVPFVFFIPIFSCPEFR